MNRSFALKLQEERNSHRRKAKNAASLLGDERFKKLFENPDFEVDPTAEEYRYSIHIPYSYIWYKFVMAVLSSEFLKFKFSVCSLFADKKLLSLRFFHCER